MFFTLHLLSPYTPEFMRPGEAGEEGGWSTLPPQRRLMLYTIIHIPALYDTKQRKYYLLFSESCAVISTVRKRENAKRGKNHHFHPHAFEQEPRG